MTADDEIDELKEFSEFFSSIHNNEVGKIVLNFLKGASTINDDRQHTSAIAVDVSPLYFSIDGAPGYVQSKAKASTTELLLGHPGIDPNRGATKLGIDEHGKGNGSFTRTSPLVAAIRRVLARKEAYAETATRLSREQWCNACMVTQLLCDHPDIDVNLGIQTSRYGAVSVTSPLEVMLQTDGSGTDDSSIGEVSMDAALLLILAGAKITPKVKSLLAARCTSDGKNPDRAGIKAYQGVKYDESSSSFRVSDSGYTQIEVPDSMAWRFGLNEEDCITRFYTHLRLWQIGWRPETHQFFPRPFRKAVQAFQIAMRSVERCLPDPEHVLGLRLRKHTSTVAKKLTKKSPEDYKFEILTYEFNLACSEEEAQLLLGAARCDEEVLRARKFLQSTKKSGTFKNLKEKDLDNEKEEEEDKEEGEEKHRAVMTIADAKRLVHVSVDASVAKTGLSPGHPALALQLGAAAARPEQGKGVVLLTTESALLVKDRSSGMVLRRWPLSLFDDVTLTQQQQTAADSDGQAASVLRVFIRCATEMVKDEEPPTPKGSKQKATKIQSLLKIGGLPERECGEFLLYCPDNREAEEVLRQVRLGGSNVEPKRLMALANHEASSRSSEDPAAAALSPAAAAAAEQAPALSNKLPLHHLALKGGAALLGELAGESQQQWQHALVLQKEHLKAECCALAAEHASRQKQHDKGATCAEEASDRKLEELEHKLDLANQRLKVFAFSGTVMEETHQEEDDTNIAECMLKAQKAQQKGNFKAVAAAKKQAFLLKVERMGRVREKLLSLADDLWLQAFVPIVAKLQQEETNLERQAHEQILEEKHDYLLWKAESVRHQKEEQLKMYYALCFHDHVERAREAAKSGEEKFSKEASLQREQVKDMTLKFWHRVFAVGECKPGAKARTVPSLYFTKCIYELLVAGV